eukprot:s3067_g4.t1
MYGLVKGFWSFWEKTVSSVLANCHLLSTDERAISFSCNRSAQLSYTEVHGGPSGKGEGLAAEASRRWPSDP